VLIARRTDDGHRMVAIGFHPGGAGMRYQLATPLLIGNILRWLAPDAFRSLDLSASSAGTVNAELDAEPQPDSIHVIRADGQQLPFTLNGRSLHFFSGTPGIVRVVAGSHESVYSLSLPGMWTTRWAIPASARRGTPALREKLDNPRDLLAEWMIFGRMNRLLRRPIAAVAGKLRKAS